MAMIVERQLPPYHCGADWRPNSGGFRSLFCAGGSSKRHWPGGLLHQFSHIIGWNGEVEILSIPKRCDSNTNYRSLLIYNGSATTARRDWRGYLDQARA